MRSFAAFALVFSSSLAFAGEGILGTKGETASTFQATQSSGGSFLQMIFALLIVLGIMKFALPKILSAKVFAKLGGKLTTRVDSSIKIEESATFPGGALHLVTVRGRVLLLGSTATAINTLADLGNGNTPDPGPAFMDYLTNASTEAESLVAPAQDDEPRAVVETISAPQEQTHPEVHAALDRLQKLMR
jgi:flagellar biogenesis protein FliO